MDAVIARLKELDTHEEAVILTCAGPPCPDNSRIMEGAGTEGLEGIKFEQYCQWQKDILKRAGKRLTANRRDDIQYFEDNVGCEAVIFDANQFKRISRPRCVESPSAGKTTPWQVSSDTTWHGRNTLVCPQRTSEAHIPNGWSSPKCWLAGEHLPCFTTPAPTEAGRAGSRFTKGKLDSAI